MTDFMLLLCGTILPHFRSEAGSLWLPWRRAVLLVWRHIYVYLNYKITPPPLVPATPTSETVCVCVCVCVCVSSEIVYQSHTVCLTLFLVQDRSKKWRMEGEKTMMRRKRVKEDGRKEGKKGGGRGGTTHFHIFGYIKAKSVVCFCLGSFVCQHTVVHAVCLLPSG